MRVRLKSQFFLLLLVALGILQLFADESAKSVGEFIRSHKKAIYQRLKKHLEAADIQFPPEKIRLAVFKKEKMLEVWLPDRDGDWAFVKNYKFTATSGGQGPKLMYGDLQIPEGIYGIDTMYLSTEYHLALHIDHPNDYDRAMVALDGRDSEYMSTGINIHGGAVSYGCVVVGDKNIEEIFYLSYLAKKENTEVYIFPHDTDRSHPVFRPCEKCPVWIADLYTHLERAIVKFERE